MHTPYTDDAPRDADIYYLQVERQQEEQAQDYAERVTEALNDLSTFKAFLWDIDPDTPEVQAFFGCKDESAQDKVFAYDIFMNLYEEYVNSITEL